MLESAIEILSSVPWGWILVIAFFFTFLENVFPPAPCDSILLFTGTLVGIGVIDFTPLLLVSTAGSVIGFWTMFQLGKSFGIKIVDSHRFKFINRETLEKPDIWFKKYGYIIIVVNRFLSGTRAVISFFAGISNLSPYKTLALSGLSALLWNAILIGLGVFLGSNWDQAEKYIRLYGLIILPIILILISIFVYKWIKDLKKKRHTKKTELVRKAKITESTIE